MHPVLIVLGAALDPSGTPGRALRFRLETAAAAFSAGRAPQLIITGHGETPCMHSTLLSLGVPSSAILVEPRARSTRENALHCATLMHTHSLDHALLITQPFHMRRALTSFTRAGISCAPLPAPGTPHFSSHMRELTARAYYALRRW